jgi:hypothetical protein
MALDAWLWTHGSGRMALDRKSTPLAGERAALARKLYHQAKNISHRLLAESWAEKLSPSARARSSAIRRACMT